MRKATRNDKKRVVQILCESFENNPHFKYLIGERKRKKHKLKLLASYAYGFGMRRNGVFISDNEQGVTIILQSHQLKSGVFDYFCQLTLLFNVFDHRQLFSQIRLEQTIQAIRPRQGNFIYVWFLGVSNEGRGSHAAREMQKFIFQYADSQNLILLLETTELRNKIIYNRLGIREYFQLQLPAKPLTVWFMSRMMA